METRYAIDSLSNVKYMQQGLPHFAEHKICPTLKVTKIFTIFICARAELQWPCPVHARNCALLFLQHNKRYRESRLGQKRLK